MNLLKKVKRKIVLFIKPQGKFTEEVLFWEEFLSGSGPHAQYFQELSTRQGRKKYFPEDILTLISKFKKKLPSILDCGSGPYSNLSYAQEAKLALVTAVDPLANDYAGLLHKFRLSYPIIPVKGHAESLISLFGSNTFDVVYSRNALDHVQNVQQAFGEMTHVCKPKGFISIEGKPYEGTRRRWKGLHKHNLYAQKDGLYSQEPDGTVIKLNEKLPVTLRRITHLSSWFSILFQKK